jgi:HlyD family secretion protein
MKNELSRFIVALTIVASLAGCGRNRDDDLTLYGNVDIREVELSFRVPGRLTEVAFDEGDAVKAGTTVARLDAVPFQQALAAADARVAAAEANLAKLEAGPRPQEIQQARAQVREAEASFRAADRDLKRQLGLEGAGAASQKTLDTAQARADEAAAHLATARETLALAEEGYRAEDIAGGRAELATAQAQRDQARTQLADTELGAPSDGTVLARAREPGTMLSIGSAVYTLSLDKPVYVRAYVAEPDLGRVSPGSKVTITTDSSDKTFRGQVGFVSPRAEFTPRSVETTELRTDLVYRLRIVVEDPDSTLRQGMPVSVNVSAGSES